MNTLTVVLFACFVVLARAKPSIVGASGVVSAIGAAGPVGVVTGHGAVGPLGIPGTIVAPSGLLGAGIGATRIGLGGAILAGDDDGQWHGEGLLASQDLTGQINRLTGIHDGQWRGEGLLAAQDLAGRGVAIIAPAGHGW